MAAAGRELAEEVSLTASTQEIGWFYVDNRRKSAKMHVFLATQPKKTNAGKKDPEEEFEEHWLSESEIDQLITNKKLVIYSALATWAIYKNHIAR